MKTYLMYIIIIIQVLLTAVAFIIYYHKYKLINIYSENLIKKEQRCEELLEICESMVLYFNDIYNVFDNIRNESNVSKKMTTDLPAGTKSNKTEYIQVLKLAEQGLNANEIARKVKLGKGEVELLLGIANKKSSRLLDKEFSV